MESFLKTIFMSNTGTCQRVGAVLGLAAIFSVSMLSSAYAYVDPGSGSVIVTTILGLFAAIGYTFRKFFYNIKRKLTGSSKSSSDKK